jgi:hypothetical protein
MTTPGLLGYAAAIAIAVIVLVGGTRLLGWTAAVLPIGADRRTSLRRWLPAVQLGFVITVVVLAAVFAFDVTATLVVIAVIALLVIGGAWFAIRDVVAGVVLRTEHGFEPGNALVGDDIAGRIQRVGVRSLEIESSDGRRVRLPWSRLRSVPLSVERPRSGGRALHFTVTLPRRGGGRDDIARIRSAALHAFFASARREPYIRLSAEDDRSRQALLPARPAVAGRGQDDPAVSRGTNRGGLPAPDAGAVTPPRLAGRKLAACPLLERAALHRHASRDERWPVPRAPSPLGSHPTRQSPSTQPLNVSPTQRLTDSTSQRLNISTAVHRPPPPPPPPPPPDDPPPPAPELLPGGLDADATWTT